MNELYLASAAPLDVLPTSTKIAHFGSGNSFFATDAPYDLSGGEDNIRDTIDVIESLNCTEEDRQVIYEKNTRELILGG